MCRFPMFLAIAFVSGLLMLAPSVALAQSSRYEEPIRYRQAVMTMTKRHYELIASMSKGRTPFNREELERNAAVLEMLARVSLDGFVAGSDEGVTKAKPEIWKEWPRFRSLMEKYHGEVGRLQATARNGQPAAVKAIVEDLTRVCKNCHDDFKKSSTEN